MLTSRYTKATMTLAILAMAWLAAAQETPPADPPQEEEAERPIRRWNLDFGFADWGNLSGNQHRLNQYGTVPKGFVIRDFGMAGLSNERGSAFRFGMRGALDGDQAGEAQLVLGGKLFARFSGLQRDSYDPTPIIISESSNRSLNGSVTYAVLPTLSAFVQVDERRQNRYYEPPKDEVRDRTRNTVAGLSGNLFGGEAELTYSNYRYLDRTGENPNSTRRTLSATFGTYLSPNFAMSGTYSKTKVEQNFRFDSKSTQWGVDGLFEIDDQSQVSFFAQRDTYDLPNSENNFVRKRMDAGINFRTHLPTGIFQIGFKHKELERYQDEFDFVDVPSFDRLDAKWSSKFLGDYRYALKANWEHAQLPDMVVGGDERQLIFDEKFKGQIKVDGGGEKLSGYGIYDFGYLHNGPRSINIYSHTLTLGGNLMVNDTTSAYLEIFTETYSASNGTEETGENLNAYFPSGVTVAAGSTWMLTPTSSLTLGASHFFSRNENPLYIEGGNVRSTQLTLNYQRQLGEDQKIEATLAPWAYTDRLVDQMGYRATVLSISYSIKF